MGLLVIIVSIFFIVAFSLIVFGILSKPKLRRLVIDPGRGNYNKNCFTEKTTCHTDQDCLNMCNEAQAGEEVVCQAIPDTAGLTKEQQQILGASGPGCNGTPEENAANPDCQGDRMKPSKYCIPAKATASLKNCNQSHGGIPVFSGWSGTLDHMEFDCLCTYPLWASSRQCDSTSGGCTGQCLLNPGVCQGGTFHWDLTTKAQAPIAQLCECRDGDILVVSNEGLPRCVPSNMQSWYTDLDLDTGQQGGQQRIFVRGTKLSAVNKGIVCLSSCPNGRPENCPSPGCEVVDGVCTTVPNQYTTCPNGCCTLPNAVCCGEYCCPTGYSCDMENQRCVQDACCDSGQQGDGGAVHCTGSKCCPTDTPCNEGCCPISGGVCCGDNTCCPAGYTCDPSGKGCNPGGTELCQPGDKRTSCTTVKDGKCSAGSNNTQCDNGCCPLIDGNCCGDYCCPSEYPVCNYETKSCSMQAP